MTTKAKRWSSSCPPSDIRQPSGKHLGNMFTTKIDSFTLTTLGSIQCTFSVYRLRSRHHCWQEYSDTSTFSSQSRCHQHNSGSLPSPWLKYRLLGTLYLQRTWRLAVSYRDTVQDSWRCFDGSLCKVQVVGGGACETWKSNVWVVRWRLGSRERERERERGRRWGIQWDLVYSFS